MPEALPEVIHIRWRYFHACIVLDNLPKLENQNIIRLIKIMCKDPDRNREAAEVLRAWAEQYVEVAGRWRTKAVHKRTLKILEILNKYLF